jgi:hypothetical protein
MNEHRLVKSQNSQVISFAQPFSSFDYIDKEFGDNNAVHRLFSLARTQKAKTLLTENIDPAGIISDENDEIKNYAPDYRMQGLRRISFWTSQFSSLEETNLNSRSLVGYAILKHDVSNLKNVNKWHVFEAVFLKYPDIHNCVPNPMNYKIRLGDHIVNSHGLLYAQQNRLNKACAQVALKTLLSRYSDEDISYREINKLAKIADPNNFSPAKGLNVLQIREVLRGYKVGYRDIDYTTPENKKKRFKKPYQKYVYSGIESGAGALLGFRLKGPAIPAGQSHIIPFYGHTFNKDTWAPDAEGAYFHAGEDYRFVSSEYWTSSFLGHDDNFGPNFCVPRLYVDPEQVDYVAELLRSGMEYNGAQAEAFAIQTISNILNQIDTSSNAWLERLAFYARPDVQRIVLRTVAVDRETYVAHLSSEKDWLGNIEDTRILEILEKGLPPKLWVVEVSIPHLFPANERKLGEIVLDARLKINPNRDNLYYFLIARLPGYYVVRSNQPRKGHNFLQPKSNFTSHLQVIRL